MSVLIISLPRTGSTSLLYRIAKEKNLKPIFEPFDGTNRFKYNNEKNVVVKTIICHHSDNLELSKSFDDIILLSRKNLLECAESHAYRIYFRDIRNFSSNQEYFYEEVPKEIFELCYSDIIKWHNQMIELSNKLTIPITYYEDIFDMNSNQKLRKGNKPTKLNLI